MEFENKMNGNKNGSKTMTYKQENYIRNLLTYKIITKNYPGYTGYVLKLLQGNPEITMTQASYIIDTLKNMIDIENAKLKSNNSNEDSHEEIEEKIE